VFGVSPPKRNARSGSSVKSVIEISSTSSAVNDSLIYLKSSTVIEPFSASLFTDVSNPLILKSPPVHATISPSKYFTSLETDIVPSLASVTVTVNRAVSDSLTFAGGVIVIFALPRVYVPSVPVKVGSVTDTFHVSAAPRLLIIQSASLPFVIVVTMDL